MTKHPDDFSDSEENVQIEIPSFRNLSASKIADQFWCEMQLHLKLQIGMEPTEEMIIGSEIHRSLEEELGPIIEVIVTTPEDSVIAYILQIYTKLLSLQTNKITRELPVIGKINDIPVLGIIDQLEIEVFEEEKTIIITDYKTRKSKRAPSFEQRRRNQIQMQVYWYLLYNLTTGNYTIDMFKEYFEITKNLEPSQELMEQLPEEQKELFKKLTPLDLLNRIFEFYKTLPKLSNELRAIYLFQEDQSIVFADRSFYHEESFEVDMDWAMGYWSGERIPNDCHQNWMCKFCQFTDNCSYFLKRFLVDKEKKKKK
jgi:exonuclease V